MPRQGQHNEILVGLQYRDRFSVGAERQRLGLSAFHWSIIVHTVSGSERQYHRFDVTDGSIQDETGKDLNPEREWVYRHQVTGSLVEVVRWCVAVDLPCTRSGRTWPVKDLDPFFEKLRVPKVTQDRSENCLWWAKNAVLALREAGRLRTDFDVDEMMAFALERADERIKDFKGTPEVVQYLPSTAADAGLWASLTI